MFIRRKFLRPRKLDSFLKMYDINTISSSRMYTIDDQNKTESLFERIITLKSSRIFFELEWNEENEFILLNYGCLKLIYSRNMIDY